MAAMLDFASDQSIYAEPRHITDPQDCFFYHTFELPGVGVVKGVWDLRADVDNYLGHVDLGGKRVLELGTASGFLCFEMEKRGAEVIGYDLSDKQFWDLVPFAASGAAFNKTAHQAHIRQLNNGWWLAHRLLQSRARVVYGSIYDIPEDIGQVDVATFGCILLHLQNPFRALAQAARLVKDTLIITEHDCHWHPRRIGVEQSAPAVGFRRWLLQKIHALLGDPGWMRREYISSSLDHLPLMMFLPDSRHNSPVDTWWYMRPAVLQQMLGVLGFPESTVTYHTAMLNGKPEQMFTVVGKRVVNPNVKYFRVKVDIGVDDAAKS
jgi:SAM-dependent methyltransferase